jgi:hypothetical protein
MSFRHVATSEPICCSRFSCRAAALGGQLLLVLLETRLDPSAADRDLRTELLDVRGTRIGVARGRRDNGQADEQRAEHPDPSHVARHGSSF